MEQVISGYRHDAALRASFNALAEKTFGLNFEGWYQNGFWGDNYNPYSIVADGRVVANVSVNKTDMIIGGERRKFYQLGTVMTDPAYRGRGYIREIMQTVDRDIADADGVYLFGNDSVLEFYPRFGFVPGEEHVYERPVGQSGTCRMQRIPMEDEQGFSRLRAAMDKSAVQSACEMAGNPELIFFYVSQFMKDCAYYCEALDCWAIAEIEDGNLTLHNIFCPEAVSLDEVIAAFGAEVKHVTLGFAPLDTSGFTCRAYHEEDCTFFVRGGGLADFAARKLRIPSLSHA